MSNEQAPECCPFCGAGPTTEGEEKWCSEIGKYHCGTISHAFEPDDRWQTSQCRIAERERLTRERDEARAEALVHLGNLLQAQDERDATLARVKQLEADWAGWPDLQREWFGDKYAAMQPLEAVRARIEDTEARVQRLEEAGDAIVDHNIGCGCGQDGPCRACRMACEAWTKAKEATP